MISATALTAYNCSYQRNMIMKLSVIVPFYKGNAYINRLLSSVEILNESVLLREGWDCEVIIINDSPGYPVEYANSSLDVAVIDNPVNCGIHQSRINGIKNADGDYLLLIDQDDEVIIDGFPSQIKAAVDSDVVVGNGVYQYPEGEKIIFRSNREMKYVLKRRNFLQIRNLIPSPGSCLVRKSAIPKYWLDHPMQKNGADDWFLWITIFSNGGRFSSNDQIVYRHNDTNGSNASYDIEAMHRSCIEMVETLRSYPGLSNDQLRMLSDAIELKYVLDSGKSHFKAMKFFGNYVQQVRFKLMRRFKMTA